MKKLLLCLSVALNGVFIWFACTDNKSASSADTAVSYQPIPDSVKVPVAQARHLVKNYEPHAGTVLHGNDSLPDTRSIWFSLERLEALVAQIRREKGDGIRFYFATYNDSYPKDARGPHVPVPVYWGYNTLLMVSTRDSTANGETYHRDYFTETNPKGEGLILKATAENDGKICPPPYNCYDEGALLLGGE